MVARLTGRVKEIPRTSAILCALALSLGAGTLSGATDYWVTKTTDDDGPCLPGDCSLREAILAANSSADNATIHLGAGTFTLSIAGVGEDAATTGDLDIAPSGIWVTLRGEGPRFTIVDAQGVDRVFHVLPGVNAAFSGLTITGGGNPFQGGDGGGGIWFQGAQLYVQSCEVTGNTTGAVAGLYGGGVNVSGLGLASMVGTTVADCSATEGGGGLAVRNPGTTVLVDLSTVSGNRAPYGGAFFAESHLFLNNVTVSGSFSFEGAPGIFNLGPASLRNVTLAQPLGLAILNGLAGEVELETTAILG